jgi:hypothetical protein
VDDRGAQRYRVADGVIDRAIGDELLVHRFDTDQVFVLNGDAKRIFEAVREAGSDEAVRARIANEVFGDTVEIDEQVDRALDEMRRQGLIELDNRAEPASPE